MKGLGPGGERQGVGDGVGATGGGGKWEGVRCEWPKGWQQGLVGDGMGRVGVWGPRGSWPPPLPHAPTL